MTAGTSRMPNGMPIACCVFRSISSLVMRTSFELLKPYGTILCERRWYFLKASRHASKPDLFGQLMIYQNILVIKPGAMGDLLQMTPVFRALMKKLPEARISVLVGNVASADMFRYNPHVY